MLQLYLTELDCSLPLSLTVKASLHVERANLKNVLCTAHQCIVIKKVVQIIKNKWSNWTCYVNHCCMLVVVDLKLL